MAKGKGKSKPRTTKMPDMTKRQGDDVPEADRQETEALAAKGAAENARKAQIEARFASNVTPETMREHWGYYIEAVKAERKAKEAHDKAKAKTRSVLAIAKDMGVDNDAMVDLKNMEKLDFDDLLLRARNTQRLAIAVGSPIAQLGLFPDEPVQEAAPEMNPVARGYTAGRAGDADSTNPYGASGGEKAELWLKGWHDGYNKFVEEQVRKGKMTKADASKLN